MEKAFTWTLCFDVLESRKFYSTNFRCLVISVLQNIFNFKKQIRNKIALKQLFCVFLVSLVFILCFCLHLCVFCIKKCNVCCVHRLFLIGIICFCCWEGERSILCKDTVLFLYLSSGDCFLSHFICLQSEECFL